jgi:hypothetical protein
VDIIKTPKQPGVVVFHERQVQHECNFP